jgi:hypothetical protein
MAGLALYGDRRILEYMAEKRTKATVSLPSGLWLEFIAACKADGLVASRRVQALIEGWLALRADNQRKP